MENMSDRNIYNLILKLEEKGVSAGEIISIIKFVVTNKLNEDELKNLYNK